MAWYNIICHGLYFNIVVGCGGENIRCKVVGVHHRKNNLAINIENTIGNGHYSFVLKL
jgi:hypothetical protein